MLAFPVLLSAQECGIYVKGEVKDLSTGNPISYANIYSKELQSGVVSDSLGYFELGNFCKGNYHLNISHIGCETVEINLNIEGDTAISILLDHNSHLLNEVAIVRQYGKNSTQESQSLNEKKITENADKNFGAMLENISGVSIISNGDNISKPIIHGLYGNRISIINNGIAQSGQQWGVDHSPEIDPLVAKRITVIKGVGALEYQGSSLGSVVLVEPNSIGNDPHLHGKARYVFNSNGLGNALNLDLYQYNEKLAWRAVGTIKKSGDNHTSKYYLTNTGNAEANMALQLEKSLGTKWDADFYFSSFNARIGVLRGSQIGNLTDLEQALGRDVPFFTQEKFSYKLNPPYQSVNHQLLKLHTKYTIDERQSLDLSYGAQFDFRKEFDVRRSGRSEMPALSLKQFSNFLELKYANYFDKNWILKSGFQFNRVNNTNLPETGILPLIPDYIAHKYGVFCVIVKSIDKVSFEFGARYDFEDRNVVAISNTIPREIVRYENNYHSTSAMGGMNYKFAKNWSLVYNVGYAQRNPEINELYSNGLHQGVSGIEEGDINLKRESSIKNTLTIKGKVKEKFFLESMFYYQYLEDYIFLNPQDEIRLTIRGAFPVFKYEQTNASIWGFDLMTTYQITKEFSAMARYSFLKGDDLSNDLPLVFMPSNNLYGAMNYQLPKLGKLQNIEFQLNGQCTFEQKHLLASQDFVAAPEGYFLLGLKASGERQLKKVRLNISVKVENILNETYREYLNRQRYFADDLGLNAVLGVNVTF